MSQLARRVTAAVLLAAIMGLSAPAFAASTHRPQPGQTHMAASAGLLDRLFSWLGSLWLGDGAEIQGRQKAVAQPIPETDPTSAKPVDLERGAMIDPNG